MENMLNQDSNKNKNKGCLYGVVGTLLVLVGVLLYTLFSSLVNNLFFSMRYGDGEECVLLPYSYGGIIVAFVLLEVIFISWQLKINCKGSDNEKKFNRIFKIVLTVFLSLIVAVPLFTANTYVKINSESISKNCFVEYKTYNVEEDIERCTLSCTQDGQLTFVITMNDGEKIELFGSVNSCGKGFIEEHENLYGYAANLSERLSRNGLETSVHGEEYMKKIYKDTNSDVWKHLERIITE